MTRIPLQIIAGVPASTSASDPPWTVSSQWVGPRWNCFTEWAPPASWTGAVVGSRWSSTAVVRTSSMPPPPPRPRPSLNILSSWSMGSLAGMCTTFPVFSWFFFSNFAIVKLRKKIKKKQKRNRLHFGFQNLAFFSTFYLLLLWNGVGELE